MYFNHRLWQFTQGVRLRIAWAVLVGLLASMSGALRLALLGWLLGMVFNGAPWEAMLWPFAAVAAVMMLRGGLDHARNMIAHRTAAIVQRTLRMHIYRQVVALGPAYFGQQRTGGVILSMVEGVEQLEIYFGRYLPQLLVAALTPLLVFAAMATLDLPVAAVQFGFAIAALFAPAVFHRWDSANSTRRSEEYATFGAEFLDAVQGLGTLKAFGQSARKGEQLAGRARGVFRSTMWVLATNAASRGITDLGIAGGAAATLGLGAWRVLHGEMPLEVLLVILMLGIEVYRPMRDMRGLLHHGMMGISAAVGIFKLLDARPAIPPEVETDGAREITLTPEVALEDVHFAYPGAERGAHKGLSLHVRPGERVGIVGHSGAGKSTLVRLLLRLYDPQQGRVLVGGHDIRELPLHTLRAHFAVVHQDTWLFHGTVEDNLRVGKPDATQAELEAAARAANAHSFIAQLPQGYGTVVGERGIRLSGGQRQRIAIARALLRNAPILVLDEALSSVDAENEAVIQQALERLMEGRTTIIFAHRLSSIIGAHRILVMEEGRVAESGTHDDLMARGGVYHGLMAAQVQESLAVDEMAQIPGAPPKEAPSPEDPQATGEELGAHQTAYLEPTDAILRAEGMGWPAVLAALFRMVMPWKKQLALTFALGVGRVAALICVGVLSALAVAAVKAGASPYGWLAWLAVAAPLAALLHWLESWIAHDMAFRLLAELRVALFRQLDRLAPAYLLRRRSGDLAGLATQDVEAVEYFFAHTVAPAFVSILVPLTVLGVLAWQHPLLAGVLAPFLALVALAPFIMRGRIDHLGSRSREALGELNAHAVDTVQGLGEVLTFQQEHARAAEFDARIRAHHQLRVPFQRELTLQTALLDVATGLGGLAVVMAGGWLAQGGVMDSAYLPLLTLLAMAAFLPVAEISNIGRQLAETLGATRRLWAVQNEPVPVTDGPHADPPPLQGAPALAMEDVRFAYHGTVRPALDGMAFTVPRGHRVALVGSSGAGKTTTAHLLLRFWDADAGAVRMFGHDLRDYALESLRGHIALVTQDTYLFNDTLRENIRMARPHASEADLAQAVENAALGELVAHLPQGLDTPVGERGTHLSGGQRQRVAIARAFLKDAPILILDEATSHLDAISEGLVHEALDRLMRERTTVVIAHRLSTVRDADTILVLEHGRVAEAGSHAELLARGGVYSNLVWRQLTSLRGGGSAPTGQIPMADD